jgi:hypothetical protein
MLSSSTGFGHVTAGCVALLPSFAGAQQPLQLNVPYSCQDGITRIITRCEKNARGGEVCFWREEQNGQLIVERFNVPGQMDGWLATCKAPQPALRLHRRHRTPPRRLPARRRRLHRHRCLWTDRASR